MKRIILPIIMILTAGLLFSLGGRESPDREYQFAILIKKGDESWYRKEAEGFVSRCEELGVSSLILDNKMDPNVTLMNMDLAIEKKVDALAIIIPDGRMGPVIVDRAFESDSVIVSLDHKLIDHQGRQLAPHIGLDNRTAGYEAGTWLAGRILSLDWVGNPSLTIGIAALTNSGIVEFSDRVNECQRALFEWLPQLRSRQFLQIECPGSDAVGGLLAMQELLNLHPEITNWIVFAATDESSIGAVRALEQVDLARQSIAIGIQAERAFREFSKDKQTALAGAVFFDPYQLGRRAADSLYSNVAEGAIIPAETNVPFRIISRDDFIEAAE